MNHIQFLELLENEINDTQSSNVLMDYYRIKKESALYYWRKAYLEQRFEYIESAILSDNRGTHLWDVGCGYGTASIFLSMNGIETTGSTFEWYHKYIPERKKYWRSFGNPDHFNVRVENIFDAEFEEESYDYILVQDTLHHLEPIDEALEIFRRALKKEGKIICVDENGSNITQRIKMYLKRGNKRIIDYYDESIGKTVKIGNENIRSLNTWESLFNKHGFRIGNIQYIRFLPPYILNSENLERMVKKEQTYFQKYKLFREYLFFGLNFTAVKA